jgi:hypothetical protein
MKRGEDVTLNPARSVAILALVLAVAGGYFGFATLVQDLAYTRVQTELSFWGREDYEPSQQAIDDTANTLQFLLAKSPSHPDFLILQARYSAWRAYWSEDLYAQEVFSREAMAAQYRALESRPAHRHSWSTMVEYASRARDGEATRQFAQERLALLQPSKGLESGVQEETK